MQVAFAWSLCLSVGVVLLSIIPLTIGRVKAGYSVENMSAPRALFDELPSFGKRAVWCHQNCWESISLHAPACLLCLITLTDSNIAIIAGCYRDKYKSLCLIKHFKDKYRLYLKKIILWIIQNLF